MISARVDGRPIDLPPSDRVRAWTPAQGLLWLDVAEPAAGDLRYLDEALQLHPLVLEDLQHRNQRPKVDDYPSLLFVVLFGAVHGADASELELAEVHVLLGEGWIATVADHEVLALRRLWEACDVRPEIGHGGSGPVFHRICDALVDSMFPILDEVDDEIDRVENAIIQRADETTVADIFRLKRELNVLRRILGPQRDLLQVLAGPRVARLDAETQLYLRDVYDHAVRMVEQVDSYRDIVTGALDVYLSSVSNRLGEQTRRLTIVATIFLPLTFLTGFFGMNFGVLVASIATTAAFAVAVCAMVLSVPLVYWVSQRFTARVQPIPAGARRRGPRGRPYTRLVRRRAASGAQGGQEGSP
jgi:magnesium transporter